MKIVALSTSPYPPQYSPMVHRLHCYMLALKETGHEVKVICLSQNENLNSDFEGIKYELVKFDYKETLFPNLSFFKSLKKVLEPYIANCDVFYHSEHRISYILSIQNVVNKQAKVAINELNEYPYFAKTRRLDFFFIRYIKQVFFFKYLVKRVNGFIAISHALESKVRIHNPNVVRIPILSKHKEIERNIDHDAHPYILHAGALSETKDGIKALLQAFNLAQEKVNGNLKFIFTNKNTFPWLTKWIDNFIINNNLSKLVEFKGTVSNEELNELYRNCTLAIVNKPNNLQNYYNFPTKLAELLPRSIPLIVSKTGELKRYFIDGENAIMVEPNNVVSIRNGIIEILTNTELAKKIANNGKKLAQEHFHYSKNAQQLNDFICNLSSKK